MMYDTHTNRHHRRLHPCPPPAHAHLLAAAGVVVVHKGDGVLGAGAQQAGGAPLPVPQPVVLVVLGRLLQEDGTVAVRQRYRYSISAVVQE